MSLHTVLLGLQARAGNRAVAQALTAGAPVLQRVRILGDEITEQGNPNALPTLADALAAILEAQRDDGTDPLGWIAKVAHINDELQLTSSTGKTIAASTLQEIAEFYDQAAELNFSVNPVLREAWQRCKDATRSSPSKYKSVGGKFLKQMTELLKDIGRDFPSLGTACSGIIVLGINKEHMVNKGKAHGGPQVDAWNLMYASIPAVGAKGSISVFHKALHAMKSGTGIVDYSALHPDIRAIIETAQKSYDPNVMGPTK